jgi:hypothetical protein
MVKKEFYKVRCTDGSVENYSYYDIFETVKAYLMQKGQYPSAADVDREIPSFLARMKKIVKSEESQEPVEA